MKQYTTASFSSRCFKQMLQAGAIDVVSVAQTVAGISLAAYSPKLQRLIAGVLHLTRDLFPGVVDEEIGRLLTTLPAPAPIVKKRFEAALTSAKVAWEREQGTGALWAKMRSEAPFDSAVDIVPRFVGERLFHFAPWQEKNPTTTLSRAFLKRLGVETTWGKSLAGNTRPSQAR